MNLTPNHDDLPSFAGLFGTNSSRWDDTTNNLGAAGDLATMTDRHLSTLGTLPGTDTLNSMFDRMDQRWGQTRPSSATDSHPEAPITDDNPAPVAPPLPADTKEATGAPPTSQWTPGDNLTPENVGQIPRGTAIATFTNGEYNNVSGQNHAAVITGHGVDKMK